MTTAKDALTAVYEAAAEDGGSTIDKIMDQTGTFADMIMDDTNAEAKLPVSNTPPVINSDPFVIGPVNYASR